MTFAEFEGSVLVLLEHQSSVDPIMAKRMLAYLGRIWGDSAGPTLPPIVSLVLSHDLRGWTAPRSLRELVVPGVEEIPELAGFLPSFSIQILDLITLSNDDLLGWSLPPFPKLALWLLRDARSSDRLLENLPLWAPLFASVQAQPKGKRALTQLFRYITLVASEDILEELNDAILAHIPTTKDTLMTIAEALRREGREQGLEQGLERGRHAGLVRLITKLLELKFDPLGERERQRLEAASVSELEKMGEELLVADTLEQVFPDAAGG